LSRHLDSEGKMTERRNWVSALNAIPSNELISTVEELTEDWIVRPKSIPQSGLGMLKIKDSAFNESFFLGEFPFASAWVEIVTPEGLSAEGAAQVMDDRVELAEALALCDAILSARVPGWEQISALVEKGMMIRKTISLERKQILARTQVDFSLLDDVGEENVET